MLPRGWAALVVVAVLATSARAQVSDELGIERFRVALDRRGLANVEWADVPEHLHWDAGILVGFAHAPLVVYDRDMAPVASLVERRLTTTLVGALGLYDRVQLGVSADVIGYQSGDGAASPTMESLPSAGLGDLRFVAKAMLAGNARYHVGLFATATIPAGRGNGFLREAGVTFAPALALGMTHGRVRGALNAGYLLRKDTETAGLATADEGFARGAIGFAATTGAELFIAMSAAAPLSGAETNQVALEAFAGANVQITSTLGAFAAGGVGLDNGFGVPDWRALAGIRFSKATRAAAAPVIAKLVKPVVSTDSDGDGVLDSDDKCASAKELVNGFRDNDGCPEMMVALSGRVVDPDGRAIRGAAITIRESETGASAQTVTDEDGRFTHSTLGGTIDVTATANEYQDGTAHVTIEPGTPGSATVTLVRKVRQGQLRGQVLSFDGKPLPATVSVNGTKVTADAEGNFTVDLPAGSFQVEISAPGYTTQKRSINIKLDGVTVLNIDLRGAK